MKMTQPLMVKISSVWFYNNIVYTKILCNGDLLNDWSNYNKQWYILKKI